MAVKSHKKIYFNEFVGNVLHDVIGIIIFDLRGHRGCFDDEIYIPSLSTILLAIMSPKSDFERLIPIGFKISLAIKNS